MSGLNYASISNWYQQLRHTAQAAGLVLTGLVAVHASALPGAEFDFNRFIQLRAGQPFGMYAASGSIVGERIGDGKIFILSRDTIHLRIQSDYGPINVHGNLLLRYLGQDKDRARFQLNYRGVHNGRAVQNDEIVTADTFMLAGGILTFKYEHGRRFFQMSVNKQGQNRLIAEWGAVNLQ
ncbi:MAG: hypothetical protein KDK39_17225 [Leptospiraceae bacterium]|nr:hypothetical protein [Leptospiraceae bacterium]